VTPMKGCRMTVMVVASLLICALAARSDDVRMERDANGALHISITGEKPPTPPPAATDQAGEQSEADQLSVKLSLKRTEIQKRLNATTADLAHTKGEIVETEKRRFEGEPSYLDVRDQAAAAAAIAQVTDDANRFAEEKRQRLDALRTTQKDQYRFIASLYDEWDDLKKTVERAYGKPPVWWREIRCAECPSHAEVAAALR
jgi:hypothetical protein